MPLRLGPQFAGIEAWPVPWVESTHAAPAQFWLVSCRTCPSGAGWAIWKHRDFKADRSGSSNGPRVPVRVLLLLHGISVNDFNTPHAALQWHMCFWSLLNNSAWPKIKTNHPRFLPVSLSAVRLRKPWHFIQLGFIQIASLVNAEMKNLRALKGRQ